MVDFSRRQERNRVCAGVAWSALGLFLVASCSRADESPPSRPNVILLMADDLGWGDPSFNGGWIETPVLDEMARSGLVFNRFYAAAPVCSPTRASCLTGRNPMRLAIPTANQGHLTPDESTLAEVLLERGYLTGHFGKWHLGTLTQVRRDSNRGRAGRQANYSAPWMHGFTDSFSTEAKVPTWHPMRRSPKRPAASSKIQ